MAKQYPAVQFYKNNDFTEVGHQIIVTGEALWARLNADFPGEDSKYSISIKIPKDVYTDLSKRKFPNGGKLSGLKKVFVKDEDGDATDEVDYYQLTMKQNMFIEKDGGKEVFPIKVVTTKSKDQFTDIVGNGSKVRVIGALWDNSFQGKPQMGLNLQTVQILDLVAVERKASSSDGFDALDFDELDMEEDADTGSADDALDFDDGDDPFAS